MNEEKNEYIMYVQFDFKIDDFAKWSVGDSYGPILSLRIRISVEFSDIILFNCFFLSWYVIYTFESVWLFNEFLH